MELTHYNKNCIICGVPTTDKHHLLSGSNRHFADADKLIAPLCRICHTELHNNTQATELSKICGQLLFEKNLIEKEGISGDEARERFRARYKKSYL